MFALEYPYLCPYRQTLGDGMKPEGEESVPAMVCEVWTENHTRESDSPQNPFRLWGSAHTYTVYTYIVYTCAHYSAPFFSIDI